MTTRSALKHIRFTDRQAIAPTLLIPVHGVTGSVVTYQHRPDEPRIVDGKPLKYETPAGSKMALDVPPTVRQWLGNPSRPLFITEGVRKADAAASADLCCIALLDVWNWRGTNDQGGKVALADWESIALNGRAVYIVFDSDVMTKPSVSAALERLKAFLEQRDARVRVIYLPSGDGGVKQGLDDFLASGKTVDDLLALASERLRPTEADASPPPPYRSTPGGLVRIKRVGVGDEGAETLVPLTNFEAKIVAQVVEASRSKRR